MSSNDVWQNKQDWDSNDRQMAKNMMASWSNFAKTGNPSRSDFYWPQFNSSAEYYAEILGEWQAKQFYKYHRMNHVNRYRTSLFEADTCNNG